MTMTIIENNSPKQIYTGPFSKDTPIPLTFPYISKHHVHAIMNNSEIIQPRDFEVIENSIKLTADWPKDSTLTVYRITTLDQQSPFPQQSKFRSERIEQALDKLCMQNQEQEEQLGRTVKVPISKKTFDGTMPYPVPGRTLKINSDASGFELSELDVDDAYAQTNQYKVEAQLARDEAQNQANIATSQAGIAADKANASANSATQAAETLAVAVTTIATEKEEAIGAVQNQQVNSINAVKSQQNTSVNALKAEGTTQVNLAKAEVTKATTQANNAKTSATNAQTYATQAQTTLNNATTTINTEKTNAVNAVKTQQSTSVSAVQNQQNSSVSTVKSTGQSYVDKCKAWASSDRAVEGGLYSAKHYAEMAQGKSDVTYEHLRASRVYNDKGMLLTDEEGYADVAEMNRSTFDLSKFEVVGSPTITEDGVASGLDTPNHVNTGVTYADIKDKSWKISTQAFVGTVTNANNASVILLDNSYRTLGSVFYNAGLKFCARFGDSSSSTGEIYVASLGVVPEGWYNISLSFDIGTGVYTLYAKNLETNKEYQNTYTPTTENKQLHSLNTKSEAIVLKVFSGTSSYGLDCNLSQFSITIDGKEVFNGNKNGLDVIKEDNFEVVGSPAISDDGVASGFDTNNYITYPYLIDFTKNVEITLEVDNNSISTAKPSSFLLAKYPNGKQLFNIYKESNNNNIIIALAKLDGSSAIYRVISTYIGKQKIKIFIKNNVLIFEGKTSNFEFTLSDHITENFEIFSGNVSTAYTTFNGSIDLNSFKIYVDDQLVYQPCLKIPYNISENGAKVVPAYARDRLLDVYEQYGNEYNYYTIDEENKNFTLPIGNDYDNSARPSLENVNDRGNEKLATSLMYETGNVSNDEKGYKQLTKMNRSTFDLSKFTIIGSPTITEDGVASGFSNTNYLSPKIKVEPTNNIQFCIQGSLKELSGTGARTYFSLMNGDNILRLYLNRENRLSGEVGSLSVGNHKYLGGDAFLLTQNANFKTILNIDVINNTVQQIVYLNDILLFKAPIVSPVAFNFNTDFEFSTATIKLGAGGYNGFTGSIDLSHFSITVDGKEVFNGNKTGLDVIKEDNYEVVGSPVISDDGIASGFSGLSGYLPTDYISIPNIEISMSSDFNIVLDNIKFFSVEKAQRLWSANDKVYMFYNPILTKWQFNCNGVHTILYKTAKLDIPYKIECIKRGSTIQIKVFDYETQQTYSSVPTTVTDTTNITNFILGGGWDVFLGSIDLNSFKIYVDGNLVYQPCLKIPYNVSKTGSKIVPAYARERVIDLYEQEGHAGYYTIDEEKKNFTLPMGEIFGLIGQRSLRSVTRDGASYCEIYSDKTIEQGGSCTANVEVTFQQPFADRNYVLSVPYSNKTATSFIPTQTGDWIAKGKGV